jgi:hypothetical protein
MLEFNPMWFLPLMFLPALLLCLACLWLLRPWRKQSEPSHFPHLHNLPPSERRHLHR